MKRRRSGFALLATIFVIIILGFLLRAAIVRMPAVLGAARHSQAGHQASRAAESGLEYAVAQLREDPLWRGGESRQIVVDHPALKVTQEHGNVLGEMAAEDGTRTQFRLRFNFQDGGGDEGDGRPDPSADLSFELPYVSVNNLDGDVEAPLPRGTGSNGRVEDPTGGPHTTPERSVCLIVEGVTLRSNGSIKARQVIESVYTFTTSRAITDAVVMAGGGLDVEVSPSRGIFGGQVFLGGQFVDKATDALLRLRSKHGMNIAGRDGTPGKVNLQRNAEAELSFDDSRYSLTASFDPGKVAVKSERFGDGKDFYQLPWDKVQKAGPDAIQIPGGTYVYGKFPGDTGPHGRSLRYFDMSYEDYLATPDPGPGVILSETLSEVRTDSLSVTNKEVSVKPATVITPLPSSNPRRGARYDIDFGFQWSLNGVDMNIQPSSGKKLTEFNLIPRDPKQFNEHDTTVYPDRGDTFSPDQMAIALTNTTVSAGDDVLIHGGVSGKGGTITSEGDVKLLAGRTLQLESRGKSNAEQEKEFEDMTLGSIMREKGADSDESGGEDKNSSLHLNVYAKGDLKLSTRINQGTYEGRYRNLGFKGLLYSWGDVDVEAAGETRRWIGDGIFTLHGSLVAYGSDPDSGEPGTSSGGDGSGSVKIKARSANLYWDPRFLPALTDLQPEGKSLFTLKRSLVTHPR